MTIVYAAICGNSFEIFRHIMSLLLPYILDLPCIHYINRNIEIFNVLFQNRQYHRHSQFSCN